MGRVPPALGGLRFEIIRSLRPRPGVLSIRPRAGTSVRVSIRVSVGTGTTCGLTCSLTLHVVTSELVRESSRLKFVVS
jgi:hypothetical protein